MSRRGNCYDNAAMESFWSTLKLERVYRTRFTSRSNATSEIFDFIEVFYNRQRRHTSLGGLSPAQFEIKNNSRRTPFSLSVLSKQARFENGLIRRRIRVGNDGTKFVSGSGSICGWMRVDGK